MSSQTTWYIFPMEKSVCRLCSSRNAKIWLSVSMYDLLQCRNSRTATYNRGSPCRNGVEAHSRILRIKVSWANGRSKHSDERAYKSYGLQMESKRQISCWSVDCWPFLYMGLVLLTRAFLWNKCCNSSSPSLAFKWKQEANISSYFPHVCGKIKHDG